MNSPYDYDTRPEWQHMARRQPARFCARQLDDLLNSTPVDQEGYAILAIKSLDNIAREMWWFGSSASSSPSPTGSVTEGSASTKTANSSPIATSTRRSSNSDPVEMDTSDFGDSSGGPRYTIPMSKRPKTRDDIPRCAPPIKSLRRNDRPRTTSKQIKREQSFDWSSDSNERDSSSQQQMRKEFPETRASTSDKPPSRPQPNSLSHGGVAMHKRKQLHDS